MIGAAFVKDGLFFCLLRCGVIVLPLQHKTCAIIKKILLTASGFESKRCGLAGTSSIWWRNLVIINQLHMNEYHKQSMA